MANVSAKRQQQQKSVFVHLFGENVALSLLVNKTVMENDQGCYQQCFSHDA